MIQGVQSKMKKISTIIFLLLIVIFLTADEKRDFRFIEELYQRDELKFASHELVKFQKKYPASTLQDKANYYMAMIDFLNNRVEDADRKFEKLDRTADIELKPLVELALIQTKFFLNDYVKSSEYADLFLENYSNHSNRVEVYYWKGRIALERGNLTIATENLKKAQKIDNNSMLCYLDFKIKLSQKHPRSARDVLYSNYNKYQDEYMNQIILEWFDYLYQNLAYSSIVRDAMYVIPEESRLHSDYAIILGQAYYKMKRYDDALNVLKSIEPTTDLKQFHVALAYKAKGNKVAAEAIFNTLADNSADAKIKEMSFFEMINSKIKEPFGDDQKVADIRKNNNKLYSKLYKFQKSNPKSKYIGNAFYLMGYIKYLNEDYLNSIDWFLKANNLALDSDQTEKLHFLISDIYFITNQSQKALSLFGYYKDMYPQGRFYDDVLYKLALINFDINNFDDSYDYFVELSKKYPNYNHKSTVYFYLGEINAIRNNYKVALDWFELSKNKATDINAVWFRIAEMNYKLKDWSSSLFALNQIPDSPLYLFKTKLIRGNIYYNLKEYSKAIELYQVSLNNAIKDEDSALVKSRIGWTYYLMGEYQKAEQTFRSLANYSTTSEDYLILAGNSALNGKRYSEAISLFQEFNKTYPVSTRTNYVDLNLGDCFYNLNQYNESYDSYAKVLKNNPDGKELKNAILGIKWTVLNDSAKDYRGDLLSLANSLNNEVISKSLKQIKLLYERKTAKWDDVIETAQALINEYPSDAKNKSVNKSLALAYTQKNNFSQADSVYSKLTEWHQDAELFSGWADAFISRRDTVNAIKVIDDALKFSTEADIWIKGLELKLDSDNKTFVNDYEKFQTIANSLPKEYSQLLNEEWKLKQNKKYDEKLIEKSSEKEDALIASQAYYLLGLSYLNKKKYDDASLMFMRVLYLYPEYERVVAKSSYSLIISQYRSGKKGKAQSNFDQYNKILASWQVKYLRKILFK